MQIKETLNNISFTIINKTVLGLCLRERGKNQSTLLSKDPKVFKKPPSLRVLLESFVVIIKNPKVEDPYCWQQGTFQDGCTYTVIQEDDKTINFVSDKHTDQGVTIRKTSELRKKLIELKNKGITNKFLITLKGQVDYLQAKVISNSNFDLEPGAIAFPKTAKDVSLCINFCREHKVHLRIRSGGHQHEAMCSADNVLMIRMSGFNQMISLNEKKNKAWIPVGKKLANVYYELELFGKTIPGGGCQSVNVGGLTQGGGWGSLTRLKGLTCDNILEAEVVLANGDIIKANANNQYRDLFWAIRGGGGGNFGVVTRFLFKLTTLTGYYESIVWRLDRQYAKSILEAWHKEMQGGDDDTIITVLLHANYKDNRQNIDYPLIFACRRQEREEETLEKWVKEFLAKNCKTKIDDLKGKQTWKSVIYYNSPENQQPLLMGSSSLQIEGLQMLQEEERFFYDILQPGTSDVKTEEFYSSLEDIFDTMLNAEDTDTQIDQYIPSLPKPPAMTCDAPHPHKISSAFEKKGLKPSGKVFDTVIEHTKKEVDFSGANTYVTFHALGGKTLHDIKEHAFFYGDRTYMIQIQSWWSDHKDTTNKEYIEWVRSLRDDLEPNVDGAFINFVDYNLVNYPETADGRLKLLKYYYGENLDQLRKVKSTYDPDNHFEFQMSIPPVSKG